jgi:hypothetical protein
MVWWFVVYFIVALVISYAVSPRSQSQSPITAGQLQAPVAEDGKEIPVLFGTRDIRGPNIVWYGDVSTVPIKSKGGKK